MNGAAAAIFELPSNENISIATPVGARLAARFGQLNQRTPAGQLPISRALLGEEVYGAEFEYRTQSGKRLALQMSAVPILNESEEVAGAVAAFVDITDELVASAADLAEREALRGYDAIHLAAALAIQAQVMTSADSALCSAAERRGLHVANPVEN